MSLNTNYVTQRLIRSASIWWKALRAAKPFVIVVVVVMRCLQILCVGKIREKAETEPIKAEALAPAVPPISFLRSSLLCSNYWTLEESPNQTFRPIFTDSILFLKNINNLFTFLVFIFVISFPKRLTIIYLWKLMKSTLL